LCTGYAPVAFSNPVYNPFIPTSSKSRSLPSLHKATDVRLGRIVRLLMENATVVVSGTKIADEIGTSRSEVWRLIQQLRGLGVDVAGHPATGYQLRAVPDLLLPEMLSRSVRGTIFGQQSGKHIHHYYKIGSTNTEAMQAAAAGAPEGSVYLAEEQLAGRGRASHTWSSARSSGIYCSVILRPAMPPSDALIFSLAAGLAVRAAVVEIAPQLHPDLKWPNDLLLDGKKFCGILAEMNAEATRVRYLVVGVGINVNQMKFPAELREIATSLKSQTGAEWSRVELCGALLKSLDREYRSLVKNPDARQSILRRFEENSSSVRGKQVSVEDNARLMGITEGLDQQGFLRVRTEDGLQTIVSGTVRMKMNL
jgi:BirA family biotin operon repressor/biotin-[acetyl-CoA-carboxylase] ligase